MEKMDRRSESSGLEWRAMMEHSNRRTALGAMLTAGMIGAAASGPASAKSAKNDMARQLDGLLSRARIEEVLMAYARGNDRVDDALLRSCFWPESTHKHGKFDGKSSDFIGFAMKILTTVRFTARSEERRVGKECRL